MFILLLTCLIFLVDGQSTWRDPPARQHFRHTFTFQTFAADWTTLSLADVSDQLPESLVLDVAPFNVTVDVVTVGELVTITFPSVAFTVPYSPLVELGAYIMNLPSTNLPRHLHHRQPLPFLQTLSAVTLNVPLSLYLWLAQDGAFTFGGMNAYGQNFPSYISNFNYPGSVYTVQTFSFSYTLPFHASRPPVNQPLMQNVSDFTTGPIFLSNSNQPAVYFAPAILDSCTARVYIANPSGTVTRRGNVNLYAQIGHIQADGSERLDAPVAVYTPDSGTQSLFFNATRYGITFSQAMIDFNPTNQKNLVITAGLSEVVVNFSAFGSIPYPGYFTTNLPMVAYSRDGGKSWRSTIYFPNSSLWQQLPTSPVDPENAIGQFDRYGNYWLVVNYRMELSAPPTNVSHPLQVAVFRSVDGGQSFSLLQANIGQTVTPDGLYNISNVVFSMGFGGDGTLNDYALWLAGTETLLPPDEGEFPPAEALTVSLGYLYIDGFNNTESTFTYAATTGIAGWFANFGISSVVSSIITVAPDGTVYLLGALRTTAIPSQSDSGDYGRYVLYRMRGQFEFPAFGGVYPTMNTNIGVENGGICLTATLENTLLGNLTQDISCTNGAGKPVPYFNYNYSAINESATPFEFGFGFNAGIVAAYGADLAYDAYSERLCILYADLRPNILSLNITVDANYSMSILRICSSNGGQSWSQEEHISDTTKNARGTAAFAFSQSGDSVYFWLDSRLDKGNSGIVQPYGAVKTNDCDCQR